MKVSATVPSAVAAVDITIYLNDKPVRAIVTREAMESRFGAIGSTQSDLLAAYDENAAAVQALILDEFRRSAKQPLILHVPRQSLG